MRAVETRQGYIVVKTFYTSGEHVVVIVDKGKRNNSPYDGRYSVYVDYDYRTGMHSREIVPFSSLDAAEKYVRERYSVYDDHAGAIHPKRLSFNDLAKNYDVVSLRQVKRCLSGTWFNGYEYRVLYKGFPLNSEQKDALRRYKNVAVYQTYSEYAPEQHSTWVFIAGSACKNQNV